MVWFIRETLDNVDPWNQEMLRVQMGVVSVITTDCWNTQDAQAPSTVVLFCIYQISKHII